MKGRALISTGGQQEWAGLAYSKDKLKKWTERVLEQLQLIGSDLREETMGVLNKSFVLGA